jgi:CRISPR/Cas system-associated exonuclease Cas4 (RecB family)
MVCIPISWISTYLYCKRKLYLEEVKKLKSSSDEFKVREEIKNKIFESINSVDEEIVRSIKSFKKLDELQMIYRKKYYDLVQKIIRDNVMRLSSVGLSITDFFHEVWPLILKEVNLRADNIFGFIVRERVYSGELWSRLYPKYLSEVTLKNDWLSGKISRIEIYPDYIVPIELKQGKAPKEGLWPGDKAYLEACMLLVESEFGKKVNHAIIYYLESNEVRKVNNTKFIKDFVYALLEDIRDSLRGDLPDFVKNRNKCNRCPLREKCYKITN